MTKISNLVKYQVEDLVLRYLENEYGCSSTRNVKLPYSQDGYFVEGMLQKDIGLFLIKVVLDPDSSMASEEIDSLGKFLHEFNYAGDVVGIVFLVNGIESQCSDKIGETKALPNIRVRNIEYSALLSSFS